MTTGAINKGTFKDVIYHATFKNVTVKLYASSLPAAKQRAVEYFKPKKREVRFIWVSLP